MSDHLHSDDGLGRTPGRNVRRPGSEPTEQRPLADREVPIGSLDSGERVLAPAVHAWLDGELPEASVRRGETARDVDFWNRVGEEADTRRRMRTPAYLEARIMDALPLTAPAVITPWWRREFVVTPAVASGAVAATAAVAAIATALVMSALR